MDERCQGIILRVHPLTETSLIIRWLTREFGRLATVAKGARRAKSPFRGKLDLFYLADFTFRRSPRSELHTLGEVSLRDAHPFLRKEIGYVQQVSYCTALIEQTCETESSIPVVFDLLKDLLEAIKAQPPLPQTILAFELKLLNELGLKPDTTKSRLSSEACMLLQMLDATAWPEILCLRLSRTQLVELKQFLHGFLIYHLGKIPKGRESALMSE